MTTAARAPRQRWLELFRRHERALSAGYLAAVAAACLAFAVPPTRHLLLGWVQSASDRYDRRWDRRLAYAQALVDSGRFAEAAPVLERLDADWPAPSAEHARDAGREQVLRLLARSYEGLGRNTRTMATYDRLIAFDPNNYHSAFLKGEAAERLLSGWAIAPEARDAWAVALRTFPGHLPSLRGTIEYYSDRGEWHPIVDAYQAYLDAYLPNALTFVAGDSQVAVTVPADGRPHVVEVPVPAGAGSVTILTGAFPVALDSAWTLGGLRVGSATRVAETRLPLAGLNSRGLDQVRPGTWRPNADSASLVLALPAGTSGLRLVMRAFKPMDRPLWVIVARSFHNLLDDRGRDAAAERTVTFDQADQADAALRRPWWARSGLDAVVPKP